MTALTQDLFARVVDGSTLMRAWSEIRDADADSEHSSKAVQRFESRALEHLTHIKAQLDSRTWSPGPVHTFVLPGTVPPRTLTVSAVRDRIVERALAEVVSEVVDHSFSPFSFGYRKGLGVRDALAALREARDSGFTHVAKADVSRAFDSVPRKAAVRSMAERVPDARVVDLIVALLGRLEGGLSGMGLPQGSSISPVLFNCYLDAFDRAMLNAGLLPLRYADDIVVPAESAAAAEAALALVAGQLADLGLSLNTGRSAVIAFADGVDFLGQRVADLGRPSPGDDHVHPRRITMYALTDGSWMKLRGRHVRVECDGEPLSTTHLSRLREIVVGDRVNISTPLVRAAVTAGVDVVLVDGHGGYLGRLSRRRGAHLDARRAQFRVADDEARSLALAAGCASAKLANMRVAVLRHLRRLAPEGDRELATGVAAALERAVGQANRASSQAALMGVEGAASRRYFAWLGSTLPERWEFQGRNRRPPRDPINAMLSFGYTLLSAELVTACEVAGLDPDLGFLHSPQWGRPSLALDLLEQWRPVLVDAPVLTLVRSETVRPDDFVLDPERGCRMSDKARRAFLGAYEKRLLTRASSAFADGRHAYRELLAMQARSLSDHLVDSAKPVRWYLWR